jgi:hypothetical protein
LIIESTGKASIAMMQNSKWTLLRINIESGAVETMIQQIADSSTSCGEATVIIEGSSKIFIGGLVPDTVTGSC